jgi:transglutaminase-like putative cysteine protease
MHRSARSAVRLVLAAALLPIGAWAQSQWDPATADLRSRIVGETGHVQALPDLYRLFERREDQGDLAPLEQTFDAAAGDKAARPDVRALALELRAQLAIARGQLPQAQALIDAVAPVRAWSVIGPFANEGRSGLATVYGPEKDGYDPKVSYPGKEHDVVWRALPKDHAPFGFVDLSSAISPRTDVAVYAATTLRSDKARPVIFHLGASGAVRFWLNGKLIHEDPALHPSRFDQVSFGASLAPGDNTLLLKIAHSTGRLGYSLRIADADDAPLSAMARAAQPPGAHPTVLVHASEAPAIQPVAKKLLDAIGELKVLAARDPQDARAQEDLAILLNYRRPNDEGERLPLHAMERAADAAPADPEIALRLAQLEDRDANKRRSALDAALLAHPKNPFLMDALADYRLERGEGWQALELASQAREADPRALEPVLTQARALDAVGLSARAALARMEAARAHPELARARRAAASALRRMGRGDEAAQELKAAIAARFDDGEARAELTANLLDRGDVDAALKLIGDAVSLDPASLRPRLRAAEVLSQNGRKSDADAAFAQAVTLSPDDPDVHEQLGRHRLRSADDSGALAAFARSLSLRPQNPTLRELVRSVRPEEQYAAQYLYDPRALMNSLPLANEDLEVLSDLEVTKVFANGLSSRTRQLVIRPLNARGVDQARTQSVQYSPDRQMVKVERARIFRKDGTILESRSEGERSLSEPWYGLYYDLRARVVSFAQLEPGDALEIVTRTDDSGSNFFADYFGDFAYLQGTQSKRIADYVLLGPAGRTFYSTHSPLPGLVHAEGKSPDGGTWERWTARDVPKLVPEPSMPGYSELLAYVHVSTYKDWESVGKFYWGLVKDQLRVTDEITAAATLAVKGIPETDERARIGAVYDFVVSNTRYVGLEFGINSFKPYPVEIILNRRFGDCKDKASLMHAMLESIGIDSRLALLRMTRLGAIETSPASLAVFNHAILYVPKFDLFLDGTAEFHGSRELPSDDRAAYALIVEPGGTGSRFVRTPEASPADNSDETHIQASLRKDGSATVDYKASARGTWTSELRRTFESADERRARAEDQLSRSAFPGAQVTAVEVSDPHDIESPFTTHFSASARTFASPDGAGLRFSPFGQRQSLVESYAQLSRRALPERLPVPQRTVVESTVALPAGWSATLPENAHEQGAQGEYSIAWSQAGGKVTARLELTLNGGLLKPMDYPAFRAFLGRLDAALLRKVAAVPAVQTALLSERH